MDDMDVFPLGSYPYQLLKQIVRKVSPQAGVNLFRSCVAMRNEIKKINPRWVMDNVILDYRLNQRILVRPTHETPFETTLIEYASFREMRLFNNSMDFMDSTVLQEMSLMRDVDLLTIIGNTMHQDMLRKVLAVTTAKSVNVRPEFYRRCEVLLENVDHLQITAGMMFREDNWDEDNLMFKIGYNRKSVTLVFSIGHEAAEYFLMEWLEGESVGLLERMSIQFTYGCDGCLCEKPRSPGEDCLQNILDSDEFTDLAINLERTGQNKWIFKRQDGDQVEITAEPFFVHFIFKS